MMARELVDKFQSKLVSRKLLVWLTSTVLLGVGKLESEHWVWIALVYISAEAATNIVAKLKGVGVFSSGRKSDDEGNLNK